MKTCLATLRTVDAVPGEAGNIIGVGEACNQIIERWPDIESPLKGLYFSSAEAGGQGNWTCLRQYNVKIKSIGAHQWL